MLIDFPVLLIRCMHPSEMQGKPLQELSEKGVRLRCSDHFGFNTDRDGAILIGILLGKCLRGFNRSFAEKLTKSFAFEGLLIGIPISLGIILIYKRGCFGILGYGPGPNDYARAFYKRTGLNEDLQI